MSDAAELSELIAVWAHEVDHLIPLLEELVEGDRRVWTQPTALPGWDVHDLVAHLAHLESLLAGAAHDDVEVGSPDHVRGALGTFTEQGVVARRDRTPAQLLAELRDAVQVRRSAPSPQDGSAAAPGAFGALGWDTRTLLGNRIVDVTMHAQDLRTAVGRPGGLDTRGAEHTAEQLLGALGFVVAKRAGLPAGTSVAVTVAGHPPRAVLVGDDGRARPLAELPDSPTASISLDRGAFLRLAGGRDASAAAEAVVEGDAHVASAVLAHLAVTP